MSGELQAASFNVSQIMPEAQAIVRAAQNLYAFYGALRNYYPAETSTAEGLKAIEYGVAFLHTVKLWWADINIRYPDDQ